MLRRQVQTCQVSRISRETHAFWPQITSHARGGIKGHLSHSFQLSSHISISTRPTRKYDLPNRIRISCHSCLNKINNSYSPHLLWRTTESLLTPESHGLWHRDSLFCSRETFTTWFWSGLNVGELPVKTWGKYNWVKSWRETRLGHPGAMQVHEWNSWIEENGADKWEVKTDSLFAY